MSAAPTLRLELAPSPLLAVTLIALHAVAAASVFVALPSTSGAVLAVCLVALGLAAAWSRALLRSPASVRALEFSEPQMALELASGARIACEPAERRYVSRFMVTLPIRRPMRRTILITRGMLDGAAFRRLRIWALWGRLPGGAARPPPA